MEKQQAVSHYEREAEIARQHRMMELLEVQAKQIHNLNRQCELLKEGLDVLSREIQWIKDNAHA